MLKVLNRNAWRNSLPRVYLSGPISGKNEDDCEALFSSASKLMLGICDCEVVNPWSLQKGVPPMEWCDYIDLCLVALRTCDAIILLDGWQSSNGAQLEKLYAEGMQIPVYTVKEFLNSLGGRG